jgi:hypothetical protein
MKDEEINMTPQYYGATIGDEKADPYRILCAYQISHPCQQHAIKKLLRAGKSSKQLERDVQEVIDTLLRWQEMMLEDLESESTTDSGSWNGSVDGRGGS